MTFLQLQSNLSSSNALHLLIFSLIALPLVINPVVAMSFDEVYLYPKLLWIYAVVVPSALLVLWQNRSYLKWNLTTGLLAGLGSWLLLASLPVRPFALALFGASDRGDGLLMHLVYLLLALVGWLWWQGREVKEVQSAQRMVAIGAGLLALTNISQQLHLLGIPGEGAWQGVIATLFGGTQGHRGYLGGTLALLLPVVLSAIQKASPTDWKMLTLTSTLITWAWIGSATRGAWLAGLAGVLWLLWWQQSARKIWAPLLMGSLLFFGTNWSMSVFFTQHETTNVRSFGNGAQALTDTSQRGVLWHSALVGIKEKPLTGWGPPALWRVMSTRTTAELIAESAGATGAVQQVERLSLNPLRPPEFRIVRPDGSRAGFALNVDKVHNEYLDYALTDGIPAALGLIVLLFWAIWAGRLNVPGISASLVAYAVYLVTWPESIRFAPIAWFMLGIALAAGRERKTYNRSAQAQSLSTF